MPDNSLLIVARLTAVGSKIRDKILCVFGRRRAYWRTLAELSRISEGELARHGLRQDRSSGRFEVLQAGER
jgi:hypothetical protein